MNMNIYVSDIAQAQFNNECIGSKIMVDQETYLKAIIPHIEKFDFTTTEQPGQGTVEVDDNDVRAMVSCGVGKLEGRDEEDFIIRMHRGEPSLYLKREHAAKIQELEVVMYTRDAWIKDPQVSAQRAALVENDKDITHVLITTLARAGGPSSVGSRRFVRNFAGNNEYDILARVKAKMEALRKDEDIYADSKQGYRHQASLLTEEVNRLMTMAADVVDYEQNWMVVAD